MKTVASFLILLTISFSALGKEQADKQLAIQYLKLARVEQIINTSLDTYKQQLSKEFPPEDRTKVDEMMRQAMGWDVVKDQLADLVVKVYTKAELKAAIAFMRTPLGASLTAKSDQFSAQFASLLSHNLQKFMREHPVQPNPAASPAVQ